MHFHLVFFSKNNTQFQVNSADKPTFAKIIGADAFVMFKDRSFLIFFIWERRQKKKQRGNSIRKTERRGEERRSEEKSKRGRRAREEDKTNITLKSMLKMTTRTILWLS